MLVLSYTLHSISCVYTEKSDTAQSTNDAVIRSGAAPSPRRIYHCKRFGRPLSARADATRSGTTASLCAQTSARAAATTPAAASNKVGHPPVGLEVRASTQVTQVADPRAVHLAAVQKLTVSASEFERVLAKTSRVTERLDGRLRHAPSARFASTRRGRKARSSSLDASQPSDGDVDADTGDSRSRTARRAHELSLSSARQAESDSVEQQASKRRSSPLERGSSRALATSRPQPRLGADEAEAGRATAPRHFRKDSVARCRGLSNNSVHFVLEI